MNRVDSSRMRAALAGLADGLDGVKRAADEAGAEMLATAKGTTKFQDRTGSLRASIKKGATMDGTINVFVKAYSPHALFLEDGTKPHVIRAKSGVLSFVVSGRRVFARKVNHPGTKPTHFMRDAHERGTIRFLAGVRAAVGNAVRDFNHR